MLDSRIGGQEDGWTVGLLDKRTGGQWTVTVLVGREDRSKHTSTAALRRTRDHLVYRWTRGHLDGHGVDTRTDSQYGTPHIIVIVVYSPVSD